MSTGITVTIKINHCSQCRHHSKTRNPFQHDLCSHRNVKSSGMPRRFHGGRGIPVWCPLRKGFDY